MGTMQVEFLAGSVDHFAALITNGAPHKKSTSDQQDCQDDAPNSQDQDQKETDVCDESGEKLLRHENS